MRCCSHVMIIIWLVISYAIIKLKETGFSNSHMKKTMEFHDFSKAKEVAIHENWTERLPTYAEEVYEGSKEELQEPCELALKLNLILRTHGHY
ncbi:unnamed protein product [Arctia plantaginis]|uniref:Uncharacterized protein n=1 Tax=Arctia plantaginis TaxID=874455 RepID=A0A8S0YTD9_ARCPL|nr:unnamed protein product [Arctia plantaginis]